MRKTILRKTIFTKFSIKLILILIPALIFALLINRYYYNTNGYKSLNSIYKFRNVPNNLNMVNMGSSHGMYALNFEEKNTKAFNFALEGQSFYYDYLLLKNYKDKLKSGCIVVIPISYFSFGINDKETEVISPRYYPILSVKNCKQIIGFNYENLIKYKIFPIMSSDQNIKYVFKDQPQITFSDFSSKKNAYSLKEIDAAAYNQAYNHVDRIDTNYYKINIKLLEDMILFCRKNNFKPVLITTPFTKYYNIHFSQVYLAKHDGDFKKDFDSQIHGITSKYNISYLDYSEDIRFRDDISLFRDPSHLNLSGRNLFTEIVLGDLK